MNEKTARILVVDDDPVIVKYLQEILEDDYVLDIAISGEQALDAIRESKPDIILLDVMLPDESGYDICKTVKSIEEFKQIKVLFLSAKARLEERLIGYEAGADEYITKPVDGSELLAKLRVYSRLIIEEKKRKKAEEELRESEEKFRTLVENSPDVIVIVDRDFTFQFVNHSPTGWTPIEKLIGRKVFEFVPTEHHSTLRNALERVFKQGNVEHVEVMVIAQNGKVVWFSDLIAPLRHGETIDSAICVLRDITKRKKNEEEREKLIKELREALNDIKTLHGLLPICSSCKKIRDDKGYWQQIETYIEARSEAEFSHGLCHECADTMYGDQEWYKKRKEKND
ncbi:MAG: response regulator [Proteobacteria bacterium]|nr:response regulator [Pseudomonadota bacterium]